jgi:hypothetical protein
MPNATQKQKKKTAESVLLVQQKIIICIRCAFKIGA